MTSDLQDLPAGAPPARRFPIQGGLTVSWEAAQTAFAAYSRRYGTSQSLERLAARGGFGLHEFVWLYRGARDEETRSVLHGTQPLCERILVEAMRDAGVRSVIGEGAWQGPAAASCGDQNPSKQEG